MNKQKLINSTDKANRQMSGIVRHLQTNITNKSKLKMTDEEYLSLGELYNLGEQYKRVVIYYIYRIKEYENSKMTFTAFVKRYFDI